MTDETMAELRVARKDGPDEVVLVSHVPFVLGRAGSDLNINDVAVSRRHCEIVRAADEWMVRDLKSSNGTFVNGEKVAERVLKEGDRLKLGQTELGFSLRKNAVSAAHPAVSTALGDLTENTALWNIVELSVGTGEEKQWLQGFLETLVKRFRSERGFIVSYDTVTGAAVPEAAVAMEFGEIGSDEKVPLSRSIVDQAIQERRAIVTTNAEVDPRFREATSVAQYDIRTVMCAPSRWQGACLLYTSDAADE